MASTVVVAGTLDLRGQNATLCIPWGTTIQWALTLKNPDATTFTIPAGYSYEFGINTTPAPAIGVPPILLLTNGAGTSVLTQSGATLGMVGVKLSGPNWQTLGQAAAPPNALFWGFWQTDDLGDRRRVGWGDFSFETAIVQNPASLA